MLNKPTKIRSKKIRDSAKGEHCTLRLIGICNRNPETVVFAHLNSQYKGMGNKSPDIFGVYSCSGCHEELDFGTVKDMDKLRALQETQIKLVEKKLIEVK